MSLGGMTIGAGIAGASNAYNSSITQAVGTNTIGISNGTTPSTWLGQPIWNEATHNFQCQKVENGWTFIYRNKQYIAADIDSLMDQMKAAMVLDRMSE